MCVEHGIHLTRGIKLYTKHHDIVVSNPSLWNTYQRMITHNREHLKRELGRVGVMVEDYQDASCKSCILYQYHLLTILFS